MTDTPRRKYVAPDHFCAACRKRGKDWNGDDPTCAFQHGKPFSPDNWSCATADMVRDLVGRVGLWDDRAPVDGIVKDWTSGGDQSYAVIRLDNDYEIDVERAHCLYVTWYKRRGRTGGLWLLGDEDDGPPRPPTEAEVLAILAHYERRRNAPSRQDTEITF